MIKTALGLCAMALMVGAPGAVSAQPWSVDPAQSHLTFEGKQGTTAFEGGFGTFSVTIDFDKDHLEKSSIKAVIDTGSATAGSKERDDYLPQADWFNIKKFPQATFTSTVIKPAERDCYEASGDLKIKDVTKPATIAFCLTKEGDHYRATGKLPLLRNDYQVGAGDWANEDYVKYRVDVGIDLAVKPQ